MIDFDTFRAVLGRFATGVTVVTACDDEGRDHGMTVSAFCSLSAKPPLVLCCIAHEAEMHAVLTMGRAFVVNVLSDGQEALSRRFADPDAERFDGLGYVRAPAGMVMLDDALAYLDCRVIGHHEGGDHTIVIGAVDSGVAKDLRPLLYYRGGYAQLER